MVNSSFWIPVRIFFCRSITSFNPLTELIGTQSTYIPVQLPSNLIPVHKKNASGLVVILLIPKSAFTHTAGKETSHISVAVLPVLRWFIRKSFPVSAYANELERTINQTMVANIFFIE